MHKAVSFSHAGSLVYIAVKQYLTHYHLRFNGLSGKGCPYYDNYYGRDMASSPLLLFIQHLV